MWIWIARVVLVVVMMIMTVGKDEFVYYDCWYGSYLPWWHLKRRRPWSILLGPRIVGVPIVPEDLQQC